MVDQYYFSGTLPEENSTYVERKADGELDEGLKSGKFCYVLNSSQSGKSSLRVRTMRRLREDGVECVAIDLTSIGTKGISQEQWYISLIDQLIGDFGLNVKLREWWKQNQPYSIVTRFKKFFEEVLFAEIKENIVIFIDEIGSVLSLDFPTDDFFVFIRYCYNQRIDNSEYKRLNFCLLGNASPNNLIHDKNLTPFNIGKAIFLQPFQLGEVEPLKKGLQGKCSNPDQLIKEILKWTGGQPFLTQKLCHFMLEESEEENPRTVEQVVRKRIIENWEFQDEPQHLRTIKNRIFKNEQLAPYLLELYRLVQKKVEIIAVNSIEQYELQLSGLVVRERNYLRVYNPIYQEIFDINWIETQLWNLCPYAEDLEAWIASGYKDESRFLRGKKLEEAIEWSNDKSLSHQYTQFLLASQNQEEKEKLEVLKIEAELERQSKDREAAEQRNQLLEEAKSKLDGQYKKAKRLLLVGSIFLGLTFLAAVTLGSLTSIYSTTVDKQSERISKLKNIFYTQLEDLLKKHDWEAADKLTSRIMWEIAGTWEERRFPAEISRNFPCKDLRTIDNLWRKYSDKRFGFSVQSRIWQSSEVNRNLGKFMSHLRWGFEKQENGTVTLVFVNVTDFSLNAPEGQLPWLVTWEGSDGIGDREAYLNRIAECFPQNEGSR